MSLTRKAMRRIVEPAVIRFYDWRGDPVARLLRSPGTVDPYSLCDGIRARGSLARSPLGLWVTASHATAEAVLRDHRFSSSDRHRPGYAPPSFPEDDPRAGLPEEDMLTMDPPGHTRLRRLVAGAFTARSVAALEDWTRKTAAGLLDATDPAGFDLIDALAYPLPIAVISQLLGVPAADRDKFRQWGNAVAAALEPRTAVQAVSDTHEAEQALTAYLRDLVAARRGEPDGSILSALIVAEEEGDKLTTGEVISTALLLLVAGFETTVNLIGNGTVTLLSEPGREQWKQLAADPALIPAAIEELLRFDSPVQLTGRIATEDIEVSGTVIGKGQQVVVMIGGANRDPAAFGSPGTLRMGRPSAVRHLAFSRGVHGCLGPLLARMEARVALEELTRRYPDLELARTPVRRPTLVLRGYEHVPVHAGNPS